MNTKALFSRFCLAIVLLACSCTGEKTEDGTGVDSVAVEDTVDLVLMVSQTSRLHTAEYQVHKIITHSDVKRLKATVMGHEFDTQLTLGDRKIAIPIDVTLRAYIDFSQFKESQIERKGDYIRITLPDPKVIVTSSKVDHAATKQFADLFRSEFSDEEMTHFTAQGVRSILKSVPKLGILETARQNAAATLIPLIASTGYAPDHIVITFKKQYTERDLPLLFDRERSVVKY